MGKVGLWIDYRKAIIVSVTEKWEEIKKVVLVSDRDLDRYPHQYSIDSTFENHYSPLQTKTNHLSQRILQQQINIYYDEIIASICNANSILIFGSNTAKHELKYRLEMNKLGDRIVSIETADQMTDRQISSKILQKFEL